MVETRKYLKKKKKFREPDQINIHKHNNYLNYTNQ